MCNTSGSLQTRRRYYLYYVYDVDWEYEFKQKYLYDVDRIEWLDLDLIGLDGKYDDTIKPWSVGCVILRSLPTIREHCWDMKVHRMKFPPPPPEPRARDKWSWSMIFAAIGITYGTCYLLYYYTDQCISSVILMITVV